MLVSISGRFLPRWAVGSDLVERLLRHRSGDVLSVRARGVVGVVPCRSKSSRSSARQKRLCDVPSLSQDARYHFWLKLPKLNHEQNLSPPSHLRLGKTTPSSSFPPIPSPYTHHNHRECSERNTRIHLTTRRPLSTRQGAPRLDTREALSPPLAPRVRAACGRPFPGPRYEFEKLARPS